MRKVAILTDIHGNLPALNAVLQTISQERVDVLFHLGDVIGIGPYPAECLNILLEMPNVHLIMGNHDEWFVNGLPDPKPQWMSAGEYQHQQWIHAQIDPTLREAVAAWSYEITIEFNGIDVLFTHYARSEQGFMPIVREPSAEDLDRLFEFPDQEIVFYGHHHPCSDLQGKARYINPGSLGCTTDPVASYTVLTCLDDHYQIDHRCVHYDDADLIRAFEDRQVPDRSLIYKAFFGGRFGN